MVTDTAGHGKTRSSASAKLDPACTPVSIEERSFAIIDAELPEPRPFTGDAWTVARRLIHTSGDISLLDSMHIPAAAVKAGVAALRKGAPVFTDTEMVRSGIPLRRMNPLGVTVRCVLSEPNLVEIAHHKGTTRTRAGIEALGAQLAGSIVAIGNAPTALLAVLDYVDAGGTPPALIIGMPVGFVNAAESKELLLEHAELQSIVLRGRRGGSPLAAAAVNALACLI